MASPDPIKYSVIVLLEEQSPGFADYLQTLRDIFAARQAPYEIIVVANETESFLRQELAKLPDGACIRALALNRRVPQAVCLQTGFTESSGEIIVTCGSYQQITKALLTTLLDALRCRDGYRQPVATKPGGSSDQPDAVQTLQRHCQNLVGLRSTT